MITTAKTKLHKRISIGKGSEIRITYELNRDNQVQCLHVREWYLIKGHWRPTTRGVRLPKRLLAQFQYGFSKLTDEACIIDPQLFKLINQTQTQ